jgi:hypothetical protein
MTIPAVNPCSHKDSAAPCWAGCQHTSGPCPTICCWYGTAGDGDRHYPDATVKAAHGKRGVEAVRAAVLRGEAP